MLKSACTCPPHGLGERRPAAFVRNVHDVDSGGLAEELEREMTGCPVACGGKCQLAVQRPRVGDELLDRPRRHGRVHDEDVRHRDAEREWHEILERIVGNVAIEARVDHDSGRDGGEGVTVGGRPRRHLVGDDAVGTGSIVHHDGLPERLRELGRDQPCERIGGAARRHGDDHPDGLGGINLGPDRGQRQRRRAQCAHNVPAIHGVGLLAVVVGECSPGQRGMRAAIAPCQVVRVSNRGKQRGSERTAAS